MDRFHIYIFFNVAEVEDINSESSFQKYLEDIGFILDRADCQKYTTIYYQGTNKESFTDSLYLKKEYLNLNTGVYPPEDTINLLLQYAENWETKPKHNTAEENCVYRLWDLESKTIIDDFPAILKEIAERSIHTKEHCLFINMNRAYYFNRSFIPVFKDCKTDTDLPQFTQIQYVFNFDELENWFNKNISKRVLNTTDPRHQEKSPQYVKGKSPLLYDLRNEDNQKYIALLLDSAITDQRSEERTNKDLINFDAQKNRYIWFEAEGVNNQYHAYHLAKPQSHEIDTSAELNIPDRIKDILAYRLKK